MCATCAPSDCPAFVSWSSHLRRASSRESPPVPSAPIHEFKPLSESLLSHVPMPLSSALPPERDCFVPQTTHSPCGFTSPPQTRQTWATVPSVGFTAIRPVPPIALFARPTPLNRFASLPSERVYNRKVASIIHQSSPRRRGRIAARCPRRNSIYTVGRV